MKKSFLTKIVVTFALAVIMMPGIGSAGVDILGISQMSWNVNCTTCNSAPFEPSVNWIDPTGLDMRYSFSGASVNLNGTIVDDSSPIDGAPFNTTGISISLSDTKGNVSGAGNTVPSNGVQNAVSTISLSSGNASVDIAQGVLGGQFTVSQATSLDILADYQLIMSLISNVAYNILSLVGVSVGLTLSDFDQTDNTTGQSLVLTSDTRDFGLSLSGVGSSSFSLDFTNQTYAPLHLAYNLVPGVTYDFEAYTSTTASATVPEPMSIFLLLSGLAGLAVFKKRLA
jgi:hypothetical protein